MHLTDDEYLRFVGRTLRSMTGIVDDLGDDLANARAEVPGANTAYALVTHCLGVVEYWAGQGNLGRHVHRDHAAEFVAAGPVAPLLERAESVLAQLAHDVAAADPGAEPAWPPDGWAQAPDKMQSQGSVLLHVYEEVSQHLGQLEVLRDVLVRDRPAPFDPPLEWLREADGEVGPSRTRPATRLGR